ncbi:MAG: GTP-binding protein [Ignavibacteriae bacterium]|nr:GTP-binding protein [Ignavibacteriota bacterium]MCB9216685.1 GTP-binding protein [Ignavibacteria bacterium]
MLPLTIITGWLGSGKTTLLNQILSGNHGLRIAVIQNEFGEIGVDGELVIGAEFGLYELSNGCLCCAVNDDFLAALEEIATMENPPEHLLIETTGVADPSALVLSILQHPDHGEDFVVDGVLTLVDAGNVSQQLSESNDVAAQIAFADKLILNKVDMVSEEMLPSIEALLSTINPQAEILQTSHANLDPYALLDLGGFDLSRLNLPVSTHHHRGGRSDEILSHSFQLKEPLHFSLFEEWLAGFLQTSGGGLYRMKGILAVTGEDRKLVFQGVRSLYNWRYGDLWENQIPESRLVFIGKNLPHETLEQGLQRCVATPSSSQS